MIGSGRKESFFLVYIAVHGKAVASKRYDIFLWGIQPIYFHLIESPINTVSFKAYSKHILDMKDKYIKYEYFHHRRYRNKCWNLLSPLSRIVLENLGCITVSFAVISMASLWKCLQLETVDTFLGTIKENFVSFPAHLGSDRIAVCIKYESTLPTKM